MKVAVVKPGKWISKPIYLLFDERPFEFLDEAPRPSHQDELSTLSAIAYGVFLFLYQQNELKSYETELFRADIIICSQDAEATMELKIGTVNHTVLPCMISCSDLLKYMQQLRSDTTQVRMSEAASLDIHLPGLPFNTQSLLQQKRSELRNKFLQSRFINDGIVEKKPEKIEYPVLENVENFHSAVIGAYNEEAALEDFNKLITMKLSPNYRDVQERCKSTSQLIKDFIGQCEKLKRRAAFIMEQQANNRCSRDQSTVAMPVVLDASVLSSIDEYITSARKRHAIVVETATEETKRLRNVYVTMRQEQAALDYAKKIIAIAVYNAAASIFCNVVLSLGKNKSEERLKKIGIINKIFEGIVSIQEAGILTSPDDVYRQFSSRSLQELADSISVLLESSDRYPIFRSSELSALLVELECAEKHLIANFNKFFGQNILNLDLVYQEKKEIPFMVTKSGLPLRYQFVWYLRLEESLQKTLFQVFDQGRYQRLWQLVGFDSDLKSACDDLKVTVERHELSIWGSHYSSSMLHVRRLVEEIKVDVGGAVFLDKKITEEIAGIKLDELPDRIVRRHKDIELQARERKCFDFDASRKQAESILTELEKMVFSASSDKLNEKLSILASMISELNALKDVVRSQLEGLKSLDKKIDAHLALLADYQKLMNYKKPIERLYNDILQKDADITKWQRGVSLTSEVEKQLDEAIGIFKMKLRYIVGEYAKINKQELDENAASRSNQLLDYVVKPAKVESEYEECIRRYAEIKSIIECARRQQVAADRGASPSNVERLQAVSIVDPAPQALDYVDLINKIEQYISTHTWICKGWHYNVFEVNLTTLQSNPVYLPFNVKRQWDAVKLYKTGEQTLAYAKATFDALKQIAQEARENVNPRRMDDTRRYYKLFENNDQVIMDFFQHSLALERLQPSAQMRSV